MFWNGNRLSERRWRRSRAFQWPAAERAQAWCQRCGTNRCGKVFGFTWTCGIVCVYTQLPRIEMFRRSMGRMASSSSSFWRKKRWSSVSWLNSGPASQPKQWKHVPWSVSTWWLRRMPFGWTVTLLQSWETCGGVAAQKALFGAAVAMSGQEVRARLLLEITSTTSITSLLKSLGKLVKWSGVSFLGGLGARTGGIKLPHGTGHFKPRNEGCVLSELKFAELTSFALFTVPEQLSCYGIVTAKKPFSQHGRAVTFEERDVLGEMVWEWVVKAPCVSFSVWVGLSESFDISHSLNMVCLLQNEGVPSVHLCASLFCILFRKSKRGLTTFRKLCGHDRKEHGWRNVHEKKPNENNGRDETEVWEVELFNLPMVLLKVVQKTVVVPQIQYIAVCDATTSFPI